MRKAEDAQSILGRGNVVDRVIQIVESGGLQPLLISVCGERHFGQREDFARVFTHEIDPS